MNNYSSVFLSTLVFLAISTARGEESEVAQARSVRAVIPKREDLIRNISISGSVLPLQKAQLASLVQGYLQEVNVDEGDRVTSDKVLARIHVPEMEAEKNKAEAAVATAEAQVSRAQAALEIAQATLKEKNAQVKVCEADFLFKEQIAERRKKLLKSRAVTSEEVDEAVSEMNVAVAKGEAASAAAEFAQANVKIARASIEITRTQLKAEEAELSRLDTLIRFASIRSPYPRAVVTRRFLDPGAMIRVDGAPILTVMDVEKVRILMHVSERDSLLVQKGSEVEIRLDADPLKPIQAKLTRTSGALDTRTRTLRAEIELPNPDGKFLPGMYCDVRITVLNQKNAMIIPASAVLTQDGA